MRLAMTSHKNKTRFSLNASMDFLIHEMIYLVGVGAVSSVLDRLISYSGLTQKVVLSLQSMAICGMSAGYIALQITAVCVTARLLLACASRILGMDLGGSRSYQYRDGLKSIANIVTITMIVLAGLWLGAGAFSLAKACVMNPWLLVDAMLVVIAAKFSVQILFFSMLMLVGAGYWLGAKMGLDMGNVWNRLWDFDRQVGSLFDEPARGRRSEEFEGSPCCQGRVNARHSIPSHGIKGFFSELGSVCQELLDGVSAAVNVSPS